MTIDIIIPNYNGSHLIEKNLPKVIEALSKYQGKIIIVDDGSEIGEREKLKTIVSNYTDRVVHVQHEINKGFSSAVNTGVKKSDAEFVVLLNSDVCPSKNFLESPIEKLRNNTNLFAVGCMDESVENGGIVLRGRGIGMWKNGMLLHKKGEVDRNDTFWVSGGSSVFRRELYVKFGGMDEIYNPFYWEDIDLSYRAQKSGYEIAFDRGSIVKHLHEEGAIKTNFSSKITTMAYRNQFIFIWKNITSSKLLLNHILYLPKNTYGAFKRKDWAFFNGLFLALGKLPAIMSKRQKQHKLYKLSDIEVINSIS